jgi:ABC-type nitrate/sulfonate/bicarbonate transport system substrate-binding protein
LRASDNATALHAFGDGAATRLVGLVWADRYQAVVALPESGIREPLQLAGRRLGLPALDQRLPLDVRRVAACRGFGTATALSCLFCDEYAEVDVPLDERVREEPYASEGAALLRGEVDAIFVAGDAGRALTRRIGAVEVVSLGAHLDPMVRVNVDTPLALIASQEQLDEDPAPVADRLAREHPAAALDAQHLAALTAQKDWLLTHGFLAGDVDVAAWIDPRPLAAARSL